MSTNTDSTKLPDDLAQCHALIDELLSSLRQQELEKARLLARVEHLLRQMYGRSAEKVDPAQLLLFAAEAMAAVEAEAPQVETVECEPEAAPKKKGHGRKKPPVELPISPSNIPCLNP